MNCGLFPDFSSPHPAKTAKKTVSQSLQTPDEGNPEITFTCTPTEKRFTPARWNPSNFILPAGVGLTSSVTSAWSERLACLETVSRTAAMVDGSARLGEPPPKNTEVMLQVKDTWLENSVYSTDRIKERRSWQIPGNLTELQQRLSFPLKALSHDAVLVFSGNILVKVAVGASPKTIRPLYGGQICSISIMRS